MRLATCAAALVIAASAITGGVAVAAPSCFVGDYSTGDFSQWKSVQNRGYYGPGDDYVESYSATIVPDDIYGFAARFELRAGDVLKTPPAGGERSEVMAGDDALGSDGEVAWYRFSTMFDAEFLSLIHI